MGKNDDGGAFTLHYPVIKPRYICIHLFGVCTSPKYIYMDLYNNISPRGVFGVCPRSAEDI
jgi:hypothetical protein